MKKQNQIEKDTCEAEVLFQKLGETWYAFSLVNDELIFSPLPEGVDPRDTKLELFEVIEEHMQRVAKFRKGLENAA